MKLSRKIITIGGRLLSGVGMLAFVLTSRGAQAEHPIDVQRLAAQGEYYNALLAYERVPKRVTTTDATLAAAKSAWALGLVDRARDEYEKAQKNENLDHIERARIELSLGIIEYQEGRYQVGLLYSEKALDRLKEPSSLRSKVWLLNAESHTKLGSHGAAEERYLNALNECDPKDEAEISFLLGQCQMRLGREDTARESFERVPLDHDRAPLALRALAQLALRSGDYEQASFWLDAGRKQYADSFLDSWVDYALVSIAAQNGEIARVRELRADSVKKYPPSDYWFSLIDARSEIAEWETRKSKEGEGDVATR